MGIVRVIITILFVFFAFYFLMLASNSGKESKTVTYFLAGTTLAILTYFMWAFPIG